MYIFLITYAALSTLTIVILSVVFRHEVTKAYRDGKEYARFSNLMPRRKVIAVFCGDGIVYVYDAKMRKYVKKINNASKVMKEIYEMGKEDGLDFGWIDT